MTDLLWRPVDVLDRLLGGRVYWVRCSDEECSAEGLPRHFVPRAWASWHLGAEACGRHDLCVLTVGHPGDCLLGNVVVYDATKADDV